MFWLWLVLAALLAAAGFGFYLLRYYCGRRRVPETPEDAAFRAWLETLGPEPVSVTSDDELTLWADFVPRKGARGTVLFLHGCRSGCGRDFPEAARFFYDRGFQLLLPDQRAHGRSEGRCATYGVWERFDVRAWAHFLSWRCGEQLPLFVVGNAEGAAAALLACALDNPGNLRGVIAEGAYDLPRDRLTALLRARGFPLPEELADMLGGYTSVFYDFGLKDCRALDAMRESACPVLLLRGAEDKLSSGSDARILRNACAAGATLLTVEGAAPGACWRTAPETVEAAAAEFIEKNIADAE